MGGGLIAQGLDLAYYGMGTVFVFLIVLVVAVTGMSSLIQRFFPEDMATGGATPNPSAGAGGTEHKLKAVVQAAIDQHRGRRR